MSPRVQANFRLESELLDGLREVYERDGILPSEQVRRAVRAWLEARGLDTSPPKMKAARKRADTRKRA